jgi:hypothetical protein
MLTVGVLEAQELDPPQVGAEYEHESWPPTSVPEAAGTLEAETPYQLLAGECPRMKRLVTQEGDADTSPRT